MRTLDEAIDHYEWCALESLGECSDEARQMADWLKELKRLHELDLESRIATRLLSKAVKERVELVELLDEVHDEYLGMVARYETGEISLIWDTCSDIETAEERLANECDDLRAKFSERVCKANNESLKYKAAVENMQGKRS